MGTNRLSRMGEFNDQLDTIRTELYQLLEFGEDDFSEKKSRAKREVLYALNEMRIQVENL